MRNLWLRFPLTLLCLTPMVVGGCASTPATPTVKAAPIKSPPNWLTGDYPAGEEVFYGHGKTTNGEAAATRQDALNNISLEINLLVRAIEADYEEVSSLGRVDYSIYDFTDRLKEAAAASVEKATVADTWRDSSKQPEVLYVLYKLPVTAFYETLLSNEALPAMPRERVKNFERTFTRAVMDNLSR